METKQATVLPSGWEAQVENPFEPNYNGNIETDWDRFNENNPPRPLTQYHTPGEKVTVVAVPKYCFHEEVGWKNVPEPIEKSIKEIQSLGYEVKIFFEVVSEEESKLPSVQPIPAQTVEQAAEKYITDHHYLSQHMPEMIKHYVKERSHYYIAGANHIIQSGEYVSKKSVVDILHYHMTLCSQETLAVLDQAITDINNLKNKQ